MNGGVEKSYDEVGRVFGVSGERIRQIQERAMMKLRSRRRPNRLWEILGG